MAGRGKDSLKERPKVISAPIVKREDEVKRKGRPSSYNQNIADEICEHLAMGESIRTVCKPDHMPAISTFFAWLREYPDFSKQYTRAKEEAADAMAEDVIDIADDGTNDWMLINADDGGQERYSLNGEHVQRSRLRIETRKWLMAKMKPRKYGDKIDVTSDGRALPSPLLGGVTIESPKQIDQ